MSATVTTCSNRLLPISHFIKNDVDFLLSHFDRSVRAPTVAEYEFNLILPDHILGELREKLLDCRFFIQRGDDDADHEVLG